jgi:hypothetical protein
MTAVWTGFGEAPNHLEQVAGSMLAPSEGAELGSMSPRHEVYWSEP